MWNNKDGYINKEDLKICNKHAVKVDIKILKIFNDYKYGYNFYYMYYSLDNGKIFKSIIDYDTYKYLKNVCKVLTSQKLYRLREKERTNNG